MTAKEFGTKGPRSIYPEICDSASLGRCSVLTNALWPRIIVSCDDQGRMAGSAADVLGECFPKMLAKVTIKAVEQCLGELAQVRAIILYKVNGEEYIQVRSWWAWQQYARRAYPSRMPAPEGWSDYVYGRAGDAFVTWRDAAGLAARQGRGLHAENIYDDDLPNPTDWPEPQDLDDTNGTLTAPEPQANGTLPLGGDSLSPLARAGSRPVPSRPVQTQRFFLEREMGWRLCSPLGESVAFRWGRSSPQTLMPSLRTMASLPFEISSGGFARTPVISRPSSSFGERETP